MRYADKFCKYKETYNPHVYVFTGPCVECRKSISITIPSQELFDYRQGAYIQNAMKSVSVDDRDFLMNGFCKECYENIFRED